MHANELLEDCTALMHQALKFDQALDALVGKFFNAHRRAGSREREGISSAVFTVMRSRLQMEHLAETGTGSVDRRLAILGFAFSQHAKESSQGEPVSTGWSWRQYLDAGLSAEERAWLDHCLSIDTSTLPRALQLNLPPWLSEVLEHQLGDELSDLVAAFEKPAPLDIRVNGLKGKPKDVLARLQALGYAARTTPYSPWGIRLSNRIKLSTLPDFQQGVIEVQDEGSQLLALLVDAKRNDTVVDFCAGAGGKTLAIGATMRNTGRLHAFDTSAHRLEGLAPRLAKSGLQQVHTMAIQDEKDPRLTRLHGKIHRVLVDAPCSGLGTLRRQPALKWRQSRQGIDDMSRLQQSILTNAALLVQSKGRLVYATCSLLEQENEQVAQWFGQQHPEFRPLAVCQVLEKAKVANASELCSPRDGMYLRLWPHRHETDGFFAAIWERR
jgi:16S rRNA (cytosine967-C5)-methyltransferase